MNKIILLLIFLSSNIFSQANLEQLLKKYNKESIPYISVDSLQQVSKDVILLDAREKKEFEISHLKNAQFVGYDNFKLKKTIKNLPNKDAKIVVYCSLGIRSEDVAEKLKRAGYTNVLNLYGGIFEWKNSNNKVYNSEETETEQVHTCNQEWSKWLVEGKKVY